MQPIAIIGMSCLFPGATTPTEYWQNLIEEKQTVSTATASEMGVDPTIFYHPEKGQRDKFYCMQGGFVRDFQFDPHGYDLSPDILRTLDTVFQWPLHVAKQALTDGGYLDSTTARRQCGLVLGNLSFPTKASHRLLLPLYHRTIDRALRDLLNQPEFCLPTLPPLSDESPSPYNVLTAGLPSAVVRHALGLGGAYLSLDAACASSLYAIKVACHYLLSGKTDLMLAGAVSAADPIFINSGFSIFQAYPENGVSRPLDQATGGLIAGEGAGMFLLKRLDEAQRDGDKIYAVIRGVGLSNDGRGKHLLSPNSKGQRLVFERAYQEANVNPTAVRYVECHATGTKLGDITELNSMDSFFGQFEGVAPLIGSAKSNFGHMLTNAGMAGVIKVILSMLHETIPPTVGITQPHQSANGIIQPSNTVRQMTAWRQPEPSPSDSRSATALAVAQTKHAAVSAFGFGGTNAHIVLESSPTATGAVGFDSLNGQRSAVSTPPEPVKVGSDGQPRQPAKKPMNRQTELAIIGMGAFFGPCKNLTEFKRAIYQGEPQFIPLPAERWKGIEQETELLRTLGFADGQAPQGAYIDQFEMDFLHFRIPPNPTDQPDPQQLLIMQVVDQALQDAGFDPTQPEQNVAILIGMSTELSLHQFRGRVDLTWQVRTALAQHGLTLNEAQQADLETLTKDSLRPEAKINQYISYIGNIMAARIAALWDFSGPAFTISAEEQSAMRALEVAQMLLSVDEVDAVVVGAVDLGGSVENVVLRRQLEGQLTTAKIGEGAGAIVLKRADRARESEDRVYATIEAVSFDSPHESAQAHALRAAGVSAAEVGYVELSSTPEGGAVPPSPTDSREVEGELSPSTAVGSVTGIIGQTFAAAGIASLIKTALCLHQRYIPASQGERVETDEQVAADFDRLRQRTNSQGESPVYLPSESRPWLLKQGQTRRVAAIDNRAIDGSRATVILSEPTDLRFQIDDLRLKSNHLDSLSPYHLILVAGDSQAALLSRLDEVRAQLETGTDVAQVAQASFVMYQQHESARFVVSLVGENRDDLLRESGLAQQGIPHAFATPTVWRTPSGSYFTPKPLGVSTGSVSTDSVSTGSVSTGSTGGGGQVAFVYPGAFNGYPMLGRELGQIFPPLYDLFGRLTSQVSETVGDEWLYPRRLTRLGEADLKRLQAELFRQPQAMMSASTSYAILTTLLLRAGCGLTPQVGLGYSLGEFTMLWSLGVWTDGDTYNARNRESDLFTKQLSGPKQVVRDFWQLPPEANSADIWASFVVKTTPAHLMPFIEAEPQVFLTHINTPTEVVIAGEPSRCQQIIRQAAVEGRRTPFDDVLHCPPVRQAQPTIAALNHLPVRNISETRFYSTSSYQPLSLTRDSVSQAVARCLSEPVDWPRLINQAYADGVRIFIELGPRATCTRWIGDILADRDHLAVSIDKRGVPNHVSLTRLLGQLVSQRVQVDVGLLYGATKSDLTGFKNLPGLAPSKPRVLKTVKLGGPSVRGQILTPENQAKFSSIAAPGSVRPGSPNGADARPSWWDTSTEALDGLFARPVDAAPFSNEGMAQSPLSLSANPLPDKQSKDTKNKSMNDYQTNGSAVIEEENAIVIKPVGSQPSQPFEMQTAQQSLHELMVQANRNHALFLESRQRPLRQLTALIANQIQGLVIELGSDPKGFKNPLGLMPRPHFPENYSQPETVVWDEADLLEFAQGDISKVFGEQFMPVDEFVKKVRLPMPPYLLVSRVTELQAEIGQYKPSFIQTEYDIPIHGWYCTDGQAPSAVAVESGQCDLLLISYLGIDFQNQGERMYRLLDCTLTFKDELPVEGQTLRYDISINRFAKAGGPLLFFFSYNCYVGDKLVLTMRNGCAGFFTQQELDDGRGVIYTETELKAKSEVVKQTFAPPLRCTRTSFDEADMARLCLGDVAGCFGEAYQQNGRNPSLRLPPQDILMVDRVPQVDPHGGAWGLGLVVGEKQIEPDHWYFPCHFKDDEVLAGSLIAEGCVQLMEFYLLYLGMQVHTEDARFQPVPDVAQVVRCRGETTPCSDVMVYRMEITDIGLSPRPYAKANVEIHFQGRIVVDFQNLNLQLKEKAADDPYALRNLNGVAAPTTPPSRRADMLAYYAEKYQQTPTHEGRVRHVVNRFTPSPTAIYREPHIEAFAKGRFVEAFGNEYAIYDQAGRRAPRTPNGPLKLISRIVEVNGQRGQLKAGATLVSEYDIPAEAWWYQENNYPTMPYSILMEIGLQPCGFLTAHLGSTLQAPEINYFFRNLDGHGTLVAPDGWDLSQIRGRTVTNHVTMTASSVMGMIIQKFDFELRCDGQPFYRGFASFGYFTEQALANQVGLDQGRTVLPWVEQQTGVVGKTVKAADFDRLNHRQDKPHYRQAGAMLRFLDEVKIVPQGGEHGQGYIYARKRIEPTDWFFTAHFHEDPVMPGSLGVEAILQAMQLYALDQDLGAGFKSPYFEQVLNHKITWKYRGQINRLNETMYLELHLSRIERTAEQVTLIGQASLWRDGMRIYEVSDVALAMRDAG